MILYNSILLLIASSKITKKALQIRIRSQKRYVNDKKIIGIFIITYVWFLDW